VSLWRLKAPPNIEMGHNGVLVVDISPRVLSWCEQLFIVQWVRAEETKKVP